MSNTNDSQKRQIMLDFGTGNDPFNAVTVNKQDIQEEEKLGSPQNEVDEDIQDPPTEEAHEEISDPVEEISTEEEVSDESDEVEEDDAPDGEDEDINLYYHLGTEFKNDSFLPEDVDIPEDIDGITLKQTIKNKLREELEPEIRQEFQQALANEGYVEQDLIVARALRQGVDPRLLSLSSMYETYSNIPDDSDLGLKEDVIINMYRTKGFDEDEIRTLVSSLKDEDDPTDDFDKRFKAAKDFFQGKYNEFVEQQKANDAELRKQAQEYARQFENLVNTSISKRNIGGMVMSDSQAKQFEDAIRKPEVFDINGQKYQATELQKFIYDFQASDELKLAVFFLHKFQDQAADQLKKQVKKEVETEFMKPYKQRIIKQGTASKNNKKVREELNKQKGKKQTFLDFSK